MTALLALLGGCRALFPRSVGTEERLRSLPSENLPLEGEVQIYWNDYLVPYVVTESNRDLAFTLGLLHGHFRGGQLAALRKVSQGRIAEMVGPVATDIDAALRHLDFGKASPQIVDSLPPETDRWLSAYVEGVNTAFARARRRPPEAGLLGLKMEPFSVADVITLGRLAGTDVNWLAAFDVLEQRRNGDGEEAYGAILRTGIEAVPSVDPPPEVPSARRATDPDPSPPTAQQERALQALASLLRGWSRSGSNTVALGPSRSANGAALIANDPHLGQRLPNFWMLVGMDSPDYHAVGMMIPGLPFLALGRNEGIAWGGTNLRAASSDFVEAGDLPVLAEREERIRVRFWKDRTVTVRETAQGPIVSDAKLFPSRDGEDIALRWTGHQVSDEITAFLRANRARTVPEFLDSFEGYAVSGQNLVAVDTEGNLGLVPAVRLPDRRSVPRTLVRASDEVQRDWERLRDARHWPRILNPPDGVLVSANNPPYDHNPAFGYFYNVSERVERLRERLAERRRWTVPELMELQTDTTSPAARQLAARLVAVVPADTGTDSPLLAAVRGWDGDYAVDSRGAAAFEWWLGALVDAYRENGYSLPSTDWGFLAGPFPDLLASLPPAERAALIEASLEQATPEWEDAPTWGEVHRLEVGYLLANLPVLGQRFVVDSFPVGGSRETVYKTAHGLVREPHTSRYGSQSRHISSMDDPDHNWFVLLGGQDGWIGSAHAADQLPLWRDGDYLQFPLQRATVEATFPHRTTLRP